MRPLSGPDGPERKVQRPLSGLAQQLQAGLLGLHPHGHGPKGFPGSHDLQTLQAFHRVLGHARHQMPGVKVVGMGVGLQKIAHLAQVQPALGHEGRHIRAQVNKQLTVHQSRGPPADFPAPQFARLSAGRAVAKGQRNAGGRSGAQKLKFHKVPSRTAS